MCEPDSGSDLAALRTRAVKTSKGWVLNGTKLWTTNAHRCQWTIALDRTSTSEEKHHGLSHFIIDLHRPGISISPIQDLCGESHFNEVVYQYALLPDASLVGTEGGGCNQVMAEQSQE